MQWQCLWPLKRELAVQGSYRPETQETFPIPWNDHISSLLATFELALQYVNPCGVHRMCWLSFRLLAQGILEYWCLVSSQTWAPALGYLKKMTLAKLFIFQQHFRGLKLMWHIPRVPQAWEGYFKNIFRYIYRLSVKNIFRYSYYLLKCFQNIYYINFLIWQKHTIKYFLYYKPNQYADE